MERISIYIWILKEFISLYMVIAFLTLSHEHTYKLIIVTDANLILSTGSSH